MKIADLAKAKSAGTVNPGTPFAPGAPAHPGHHPTAPLDTPADVIPGAAPVMPVPGQPAPAPLNPPPLQAAGVPVEEQSNGSGQVATVQPVVVPIASAPLPPSVHPAPAPGPITPPVGIQPTATPVVVPGAVDLNVVAKPASTLPAMKKGGVLMRGATAHNAVATEQAKADLAMSQAGFRFWIKVGAEARISFIDGILDSDGALAIPMWYEHKLMIGGRMQTVTCYETLPNYGPCPVCQAGHTNQLVGGLSVVNHTPYVVQKGQNAGKTLTNRRQMLVAPRTAVATLQLVAASRGGLMTHCFDVYRKEKKDPRVGSVYDYVGQLTQEQINSLGEEWVPYNWDDAIGLMEAGELAKLGAMAVPYVPNAQGATADLAEIEV